LRITRATAKPFLPCTLLGRVRELLLFMFVDPY
jgi:hypothetical protein